MIYQAGKISTYTGLRFKVFEHWTNLVIASFRIARQGIDQIRDWNQTVNTATVKDVLLSLRKRLNDEHDIGDDLLTDDILEEFASSILEKEKTKVGDGRNFVALMKDRTGFQSQSFDCCVKSCVSFAAFPDLDACPICQSPRWKEATPGKTREPYKRHFYFPVRHRLLLWYTSRVMSQLLTTYRKKATAFRNRRKFVDVWSGQIYATLRAKGFFKDDRDVAFCCGFDGTKAFKTRKDRYVWPIILTCLSIPPDMRFKRKNILIVGIIPGPRNPRDVDSFFTPLVDEFELLTTEGVKDAWDGNLQESFTLKAHLVLVSTDMQARSSILHLMGITSISFCEYCMQRGLSYGGLHCPHKPPDKASLEKHPRIIEWQKVRLSKGRPCYDWKKDYTARCATRRTDEKFRELAKTIANPPVVAANEVLPNMAFYREAAGLSGESILARLPTLIFPDSFPPCTMHLYYENVVQIMFEHYAGRFFVERPPDQPEEPTKDKDGKPVPVDPNKPIKKARVRKGKESGIPEAPRFRRRVGANEAFLANSETYNIKPEAWAQIGEDTAKSNPTFPSQFGEAMTNLTESFRRMKAANWQRFVFLQSPIYFRKYLSAYHYENWMNLVQAMRLSTRKEIEDDEVDEIEERFKQFIEYYEKEIYKYDADRVVACLPSIHQLRHVADAIRAAGPTFVYAQWCMERVNGMITSSVKSRSRPDENIATTVEIDILCSLLPFVTTGMDTLLARKNFLDIDGRLKLHTLFRHYVRHNKYELDDDGNRYATSLLRLFYFPASIYRKVRIRAREWRGLTVSLN